MNNDRLKYRREYRQRPEVKQRHREYLQRPEVKKHIRERQRIYRQRLEVKQREQKYYQKPEIKQRRRQYHQKYNQRPETKQLIKKHRQLPKVKEYYRNWARKRYQTLGRLPRLHAKIFEENNTNINYCQTCGFKQVNGMRLDIHHLDNNEENNAIENLVQLCPTCHVYLIHRCGLTVEQVKQIRAEK